MDRFLRSGRGPWLILAVLLLAGAAGAAIVVVGHGNVHPTRPPRQKHLAVLPFPGTPDASPRSAIVFMTLKPAQVRHVSVQGSRSGQHAGRIVALPRGGGTSFVPERAFMDGERVAVHAELASADAGRAAGVPGARALDYDFSVAAPLTARQRAVVARDPPPATQTFRSRPDLHPPVVGTTGANPDTTSGDIFLDTQAVQQNGPEILDSQGKLIWFSPLPAGQQAFDVQVQRYLSQPVLTYFQGWLVAAHGVGEDVILDRSYRRLATVHAGAGYQPDLHEFLITDRDTALITIYARVRADLSSVGGRRDGRVLDGIVQEVDIRTGQVLWEWHALGHVPLTDAELGRGHGAFDFFHINSIQELADGNLLISARNTWAVYEVSRRTGNIIWQLGGKRSSFKLGHGAGFEWQHDARLGSDGTLTLFDNAATPKEERESRALTLRLDKHAMTATLLQSYEHSPPVLAGSQGNMQLLANGNAFIGWGSAPNFSEHDRDGRQIFSAHFPRPTQSYRAFRFPWSSKPSAPPDLAVVRQGAGLTAYASWNGATDVASWELMGGSTPSTLRPLTTATRTDFETAITTRTSAPYVSVRALDHAGHVLGEAKVVHSP